MWEILRYFFRYETSRLCGELHAITANSRLILKKMILDSVACHITQQGGLGFGKVLFCFYKLRRSITIYLNEKDGADPHLSDPTLLSKLTLSVTSTESSKYFGESYSYLSTTGRRKVISFSVFQRASHRIHRRCHPRVSEEGFSLFCSRTVCLYD